MIAPIWFAFTVNYIARYMHNDTDWYMSFSWTDASLYSRGGWQDSVPPR